MFEDILMKSYIHWQLGKRIQRFRKIRGFSQESFAEKLGIATNTLSSIETGNAFMTAQTLEKIVDILGVTPAELFTFDDYNKEDEMYNYIISKVEFLKSDKERLKILYKLVTSLL